ncbi:hypothetical protein GCM10010191_24670 [Actinomadura vinacea]|uniref:Adhesin domain-containing protein n=1 Tax=Actinomadura vinacea TaxID=115336 RepID=A0ABN3IUF9_9ACTN
MTEAVETGGARPRRRGIWVMLAVGTALAVLMPAGLRVYGTAIRRTTTDAVVHRRPITDVEIDAGGARVTVGPGRSGQVRVFKRLTWAFSRPRVEQIWAGEVLLVRFTCDGDKGVYPDLECGADLDLRIPPGARVRARIGSGEFRVRGISGDLRLEAGSGLLDMADVNGRVWARSGSGEITGTDLAATELEAEVGSGRIGLGFAAPPSRVKASAGSGEVRVTVPRGSYYRVGLEGGTGSARVDPALGDRSSPREIVAKAGSGPIRIGYPGGSR